MNVRVRLFAILRERAGCDSVELEVSEAATVADALEELRRRPALGEALEGMPVATAVNREYASSDVRLRSGDELALIPPVSGGVDPPAPQVRAAVTEEPISVEELSRSVARPEAGAVRLTDEGLSHIDSEGSARMVDVGGKDPSERRARATARLRMSPQTATAVQRGDTPKGDVLGTARLAGIQAAKRTAELIPLAHPLSPTFIDVEAEVDAGEGLLLVSAEAPVNHRTGGEVEAM